MCTGYLIGGRWADVIDYRRGDSHDVIPTLDRPVDFFIHDSLHTIAHETEELRLIEPLLPENAAVLSDTAHYTDVLLRWAEKHGRLFTYFGEKPAQHWYPGAGIGLSLPSEERGSYFVLK